MQQQLVDSTEPIIIEMGTPVAPITTEPQPLPQPNRRMSLMIETPKAKAPTPQHPPKPEQGRSAEQVVSPTSVATNGNTGPGSASPKASPQSPRPSGAVLRQSSSIAVVRDLEHKEKKWYRLNFQRVVRISQMIMVLVYTIPILIKATKHDPPVYCPYAVVCSDGLAELLLLALSKVTALLMYPPLAVIFLAKCAGLRSFVQLSYLAELMNLYGLHEMHSTYGTELLVYSILHTVGHIIRYGLHDSNLFTNGHPTTVSGFIGTAFMLLIVLPFRIESIRKRFTFESRKNLHRLSIPLLIALIFHHQRLYHCCVTLLVIYLVDWAYCLFYKTVRVDDPHLFPIGNSGTLIEFTPPDNFDIRCGQYVQICAPYIRKHEFHPFSVIPVTTIDGKKACSFYVSKCGDWTSKLYAAAKEDNHRPIWVNGPYPSPFDRSVDFDYVFLICMGVGITPGISLISQYWSTKTIVLIWVCRDETPIDLYRNELQVVDSKIFFTGKKGSNIPPRVEGSVIRVHGHPDLKGEIKNTVFMSQPLAPSLAARHADAKTPKGYASPVHKAASRRSTWNAQALGQVTAALEAMENGIETRRPSTPCLGATGSGATDGEDNWLMDKERAAMLAAMRGGQAFSQARMHRQGNERQGDVKPTDWLVLFCGNQASVATDLNKYCKDRHLNYKTEFFGSW